MLDGSKLLNTFMLSDEGLKLRSLLDSYYVLLDDVEKGKCSRIGATKEIIDIIHQWHVYQDCIKYFCNTNVVLKVDETYRGIYDIDNDRWVYALVVPK